MASKKRKKRRPRRPLEAAPASSPPSPPSKSRRGFAAAADDRPPAPWGSFPLIEIAIFVGLVMLVLGLVGVGDGPLLIGIGLGLAGLGGLELAIREHFAGFRSHSTLLGGVPAIAILALLFYTETLEPGIRVAVSLAVFAAATYGLAMMFRRKAGVAVKLR